MKKKLLPKETIDATAVLHNLSILWNDELPEDEIPVRDGQAEDDLQAVFWFIYLWGLALKLIGFETVWLQNCLALKQICFETESSSTR